MAAFGLTGEIAARSPDVRGPGTYKPALFDAAAALTQEQLDAGQKIKYVITY